MAKTLTVRIDDATYQLIADAAEADNRSVSNFIETAAREKASAEISSRTRRWLESGRMRA